MDKGFLIRKVDEKKYEVYVYPFHDESMDELVATGETFEEAIKTAREKSKHYGISYIDET